MSMKNPLTLAGIEPATFRFVAQHLNHCATAVPLLYIYIYYKKLRIINYKICFNAHPLGFKVLYINPCGPGSSVGKATELLAGRFGIESRWGRDFPPVQTGPRAHPASCKMGTGFFPGVKCGRGVLLTTHSLLVPRSWKS